MVARLWGALSLAALMSVAAFETYAHVINDERVIPLGETARGELLDCLRNNYGTVTCRMMLTNAGDSPTRTAPLCVVGSRLTTPSFDQQRFLIFQTTEKRAQYGNRECLTVDLAPQESTLVKMSTATNSVPRLNDDAVFPEFKLMVGDKPVFFSDIPNKLY